MNNELEYLINKKLLEYLINKRDALKKELDDVNKLILLSNSHLAYQREEEDYGSTKCEYYILGIIDKTTGKFKDFYYNCDLQYEEYSKLVPPEFVEASESIYEFCPHKHPNKSAVDILKQNGYIEYKKS